MINVRTLPRWWQPRAALLGRPAARDTVGKIAASVYPDDRAGMERQQAVLATVALGWGSCFETPRTFFWWGDGAGPKAS